MFQPYMIITGQVHKREVSTQLPSGVRPQGCTRLTVYNIYIPSLMALGTKMVKAAMYTFLELLKY